MTSTNTTVGVEAVSLTITLASSDTVELSRVESSKVYVGAWVNNSEVKEINWTDADASVKAAHPIVGTFTASAVFATTPTAAQYASIASKTASFNVTAQGNVALVGSDGQTAVSPKVNISFKADGTINTVTVTNATFAIRTNNKDGLEWSTENPGDGSHTATYHTLDKIVVAEQTVDPAA